MEPFLARNRGSFRLVHGYDAVDLDILWDIVEFDLSLLVDSLAAILDE